MSSQALNESAKYSPPAEGSNLFANMGDAPPWLVSCVVHVAVLFVLYQITMTTVGTPEPAVETVLTEPPQTVEPEYFKFDVTRQDQLGNDSPLNVISPGMMGATKAASNPQREVERDIEGDSLAVGRPSTDNIARPSEGDYGEGVTTNGSAEYAGGTEGAIDRLAYEIAGSLKEKKTLVVWLFDASLSLKERRIAIADRFENVYDQLDQLKVNDDRALKTAIASFGKETHLITPEPVDDVTQIVDAVKNIKNDESGRENVFAAVQTVVNKWKSYRTAMHRNVMVILVTDERGDDFAIMEDVIKETKRLGIRVYCVGNAAPFGREKGYVTWKYEDGGTEELPVDAGPETVAAEHMRLGFWGTSGQGLDRMSAGMGPWALTRLCAETNGLYLVSAESVSGPQFDPEIMRLYQPEYAPVQVYQQALKNNQAKQALLKAVEETEKTDIVALSPQLVFRADNDNVLRTEISEAQKPAAVFDFKLQQLQLILEGGEKDRERLTTPRWRASYDLALGRVLALRSRGYGYNAVLAEMKATPKTFKTAGNNRWRLVPSREISGGPPVRKIAKKAEDLLKRVIDEHPGTPWAMIAERELSAPLGWEWQEFKENPPPMMQEGNNNNDPVRLQLAEEQRKREQQRRMAEAKRVKPNL